MKNGITVRVPMRLFISEWHDICDWLDSTIGKPRIPTNPNGKWKAKSSATEVEVAIIWFEDPAVATEFLIRWC